MGVNLKNYTSSVPVQNSIGKIEFRLAKAGAIHITKSYDKQSGSPTGMIFQLANNILYKMPANTEKVIKYMIMSRSREPEGSVLDNIRKQGERTAWKNLSEWVDLITSLVAIDQIQFEEAFMPYMFSQQHNKTFFELASENNFKMLEAKSIK